MKILLNLLQRLNDKLKINHIDWHKLKSKKINRSAELISAALCQLLNFKERKRCNKLFRRKY